MLLWHDGEPQTTPASHIPPWLGPSNGNKQGAPRGLSAAGSKHQGGRLQALACRSEQGGSLWAREAPKRPAESLAHARPLSHPVPQERAWEETGRPQQASSRSSACPVETQLPSC